MMGLAQCGVCKKGKEENKLVFYKKEGLKNRHSSYFLLISASFRIAHNHQGDTDSHICSLTKIFFVVKWLVLCYFSIFHAACLIIVNVIVLTMFLHRTMENQQGDTFCLDSQKKEPQKQLLALQFYPGQSAVITAVQLQRLLSQNTQKEHKSIKNTFLDQTSSTSSTFSL